MKKILFLCCLGLILSSCALNMDSEASNDYVLTEQDKAIINNILETELQTNGWKYDYTYIRFGEGYLPSEGDENYDILKSVSEKTGYSVDLWNDGEKMATAYSVLFHQNGDLAGEARFYFKNNTIICGYYTYNGKIYSIDDEAVFLTEPGFEAFENTEYEGNDYTPSDITLPFDNFSAVSPNSGMTGVIEDDKLNFYTLGGGAFQLSKSYSRADLGGIPIDADFDTDGRCAVLCGERAENGSLVSKKIVMLDELLNPQNADFALYIDSFNSLVFDNGIITLSSKSVISEFDSNTHQNVNNVHLIHLITGIYSVDLYGNGVKLYVITDNSNLYVYDSTFKLLWRTYNAGETYSKYIYFSDSNFDGIKEIYADNIITGSTDKFVLDSTGFKKAASISPGSRLLAGDFDCNGRSEIIAFESDGTKLYN